MPRSRSRSMSSSTWSIISRSESAPVRSSSRSARVDLPFSMWAMIEKLRMRSGGCMDGGRGGGLPADPFRRPLLGCALSEENDIRLRSAVSTLGILALAAAAEGQEAPATPGAPKTTVLRAARLFDGRSDRAISGAVIVVEGSKIKAVGPGLAVPAGAEVIDLGDATLLPGLIDSHTHLTGESTDNWSQGFVEELRRTVAERAILSTMYARRTLEAGFTTVRDVGAGDYLDVGLRNAIRSGAVPGPRMLVAVTGLGSRGGHCDSTGFPYRTFGEESGLEEGVASGADGFRDAVRFAVKYGADVIKVCGTGGVLSPGDEVDTPQISAEEMASIVEEAHRLRRKVAVHAHGAEGAKVAIRAGADSIEHGRSEERRVGKECRSRVWAG